MIRSTRQPLGYLIFAGGMRLSGLYFIFAAVRATTASSAAPR